jgi:hypothetical protein
LLCDDTHVNGTRSLRAILDLKLYLSIFPKARKLSFKQPALMKEYLSAVGVADEPESSVAYYFLDLTRMHDAPFDLKRFSFSGV